jgi:hypothetical protein
MFELRLDNMLVACKTHNIPILLIAPKRVHLKARKLLGNAGPNVHIVSPEELEDKIREYV